MGYRFSALRSIVKVEEGSCEFEFAGEISNEMNSFSPLSEVSEIVEHIFLNL